MHTSHIYPPTIPATHQTRPPTHPPARQVEIDTVEKFETLRKAEQQYFIDMVKACKEAGALRALVVRRAWSSWESGCALVTKPQLSSSRRPSPLSTHQPSRLDPSQPTKPTNPNHQPTQTNPIPPPPRRRPGHLPVGL